MAAPTASGTVRAWILGVIAFCALIWLADGTLRTLPTIIEWATTDQISPDSLFITLFRSLVYPDPGLSAAVGFAAGGLAVASLPRRTVASSAGWAVAGIAAVPGPVLALAVPTLFGIRSAVGAGWVIGHFGAGWVPAGLGALLGGLLVVTARRTMGRARPGAQGAAGRGADGSRGEVWTGAADLSWPGAAGGSGDATGGGASGSGRPTWPAASSSRGSRAEQPWWSRVSAAPGAPDLSDGAAARRFGADDARGRISDAAAEARARVSSAGPGSGSGGGSARASGGTGDSRRHVAVDRLSESAAAYFTGPSDRAAALRAKARGVEDRLDSLRRTLERATGNTDKPRF